MVFSKLSYLYKNNHENLLLVVEFQETKNCEMYNVEKDIVLESFLKFIFLLAFY